MKREDRKGATPFFAALMAGQKETIHMLHELGLDEQDGVHNPFRQEWRGQGSRKHAADQAENVVTERRQAGLAAAEAALTGPAEAYAAMPSAGNACCCPSKAVPAARVLAASQNNPVPIRRSLCRSGRVPATAAAVRRGVAAGGGEESTGGGGPGQGAGGDLLALHSPQYVGVAPAASWAG